jgi:predicted nucleic acid-binding OB-fold protein
VPRRNFDQAARHINPLGALLGTPIVKKVVESILKEREKKTYESMISDDDNYLIEAMLLDAKKKNESNLDVTMD